MPIGDFTPLTGPRCKLQRTTALRPNRLLFASGLAACDDAVYALRYQNAAVCPVKAQRSGGWELAGCTVQAAKLDPVRKIPTGNMASEPFSQ
jgi:hypothetical protein